ncbi:hypothetical protein [Nocardia panacis]|uniref:hypothetical protein n=1 Tax=Nocardia panacis TaxID=2340916 RepID=UPI0011C3BB2D|nr:hypothetical protein [Nocardia panacis]
MAKLVAFRTHGPTAAHLTDLPDPCGLAVAELVGRIRELDADIISRQITDHCVSTALPDRHSHPALAWIAAS